MESWKRKLRDTNNCFFDLSSNSPELTSRNSRKKKHRESNELKKSGLFICSSDLQLLYFLQKHWKYNLETLPVVQRLFKRQEMFKSFCCYSTESTNSISNQNAKLIGKTNKKSSEAALNKQKVVELGEQKNVNPSSSSNNTTTTTTSSSNNGTMTTKQTVNCTVDTHSTSVSASTLGHTNSIHFYHPKSIPNNVPSQKHTNSITIASVTSSSSNYQQIGSELYHEPIRVEPLYQQGTLIV